MAADLRIGVAAAGRSACRMERSSSSRAATARFWWLRLRCLGAWTRCAAAAASPVRPASGSRARRSWSGSCTELSITS